MYTSERFAEHDRQEIMDLVARNGLAALVSWGGNGFAATHVPLLLDPGAVDGSMIGHMARANPHWRQMSDGDPVVAIFRAPDAYVTPTFYVIEEDVPTWNYAAAHVHGHWEGVPDMAGTRQILEHTVELQERIHGAGWQLSDICPRLVASLARGVYAFRIRVDRIEAVQKMSQDKQKRDVEAVVEGLAGRGGTEGQVANRMRRVTLERGHYIKPR